MENLFGVIAMLLGIATFVIGLTAQAIKQYREKRFGLSMVFASLGTITCIARIIYFSISGAYWTIPPDVIGLVISAVILYQYGAYEKKWW